MFDVGWSELVVIGVVALVVIGPKELPGVIRTVGKAVGKLRTMAGEFRGQFDDAMREAELHEVKKTFTEAADAATSAATSITDPVTNLQTEMQAAVSDVTGAASMTEAVSAPAIEAPAAAPEPEPEPAPAPKKRRKKADDAGDAA
ncbi:MAG: sec-independent protein translocase protein [Beijerinckiaceae bacterium]|nr:MAG: sec-independent protein translocase protein [Beijerinckiaceae bacterium]